MLGLLVELRLQLLELLGELLDGLDELVLDVLVEVGEELDLVTEVLEGVLAEFVVILAELVVVLGGGVERPVLPFGQRVERLVDGVPEVVQRPGPADDQLAASSDVCIDFRVTSRVWAWISRWVSTPP